MSVTVTQVKRAFEEVAKQQPGGPVVSPLDRQALIRLSGSTLVLTLMANSINQKLGGDLERAREDGARSEREFPRSQSWT